MQLIPNAGAIVSKSLAVWGAVAAQAIPFALQAAGDYIASAPDMTNNTRSLLQLGLTLVLVPLGRSIQQNLAK